MPPTSEILNGFKDSSKSNGHVTSNDVIGFADFNEDHHLNNETQKEIVVIGSGDLGRALTMCFVKAGYKVVVASRNPARHRLRINAIGAEVQDYSQALYKSTPIVVIAIPFEGFEHLPSKSLAGRIVIDVSNRSLKYTEKYESLAARLQMLLPDSIVVKAFNTLSAYALEKGQVQGSKEVPICSDDEKAKAKVIALTRDVGFTPVDYGNLANARAIEDIPLAFFKEWKFPAILAFSVWLFAFLILFFRRQLCPNFEHLSNDEDWDWTIWAKLPITTVHHSLGLTTITLLASCYFPGVIASYLQLYRQTKYSRFPCWLDTWLKGRKNIGLIALLCVFEHFVLAMIAELGGTVTFHWRTSIYFFCGVCAFVLMTILGITSLPSVAQSLTWREFSFIHRYLGWNALFFATGHLFFMKWHGLIENRFQCIFIPDSGQIFIWYPLLTLLLKLPLLFPPVDNQLQKIRRGYEGVRAQLAQVGV